MATWKEWPSLGRVSTLLKVSSLRQYPHHGDQSILHTYVASLHTQSRMAQTEVATVVAQRMRKPTVLDSAWRASAPPCVACGRAAAECRAESDFHRLSFYEATRGLEGLFTATFVSHPRNNRVSALRALLPLLQGAPVRLLLLSLIQEGRDRA